ncbi:hypothetical protein FB00_09495 [Cellulosimicrobium funkei]|uniref:Uncharacterized protein n=1 Tax=Cellulosimicrobium funkei TaxID=264251 RepID=A0A0H2KSU4_9MICO|nr:hypothetical protein [Cellulosimicrobium funkei]KLN34929.1 hypothetical protein FB00_09495 [Cellulosimicrobium funkei]
MYVPPSFPRYRPTTPLAAPSPEAARPSVAPLAVGHDARPPLTLEWLVARDIDAYTARRRSAATMDAQASTRPSPASLRKNGTRAVGQA